MKRWFVAWLVLGATVRAADDARDGDVDLREVQGQDDLQRGDTDFPRVHVQANVLGEVLAGGLGGELAVSWAPSPHVDLGLGVSVGNSVGALVLVEAHLARRAEQPFGAFVQARGAFHFQTSGYGGGLWAGASLELGPGRLRLGPAVELFAPVEGFHPWALLVLGGYELDLARPAAPPPPEATPLPPTRPAGRVRVRERAPPPPGRARLNGRLMSLDGVAVEGQLLAGSATFDAKSEFELDVSPGETLVVADAPGFLLQAARLTLPEAETTAHDFVLRPRPRAPAVRLDEGRLVLKRPVEFEEEDRPLLALEAHALLDEVVDLALRHPELELVVEGFADSTQLSKQRAAAVARYLIGQGVAPERLRVEGLGRAKSGRGQPIHFRVR